MLFATEMTKSTRLPEELTSNVVAMVFVDFFCVDAGESDPDDGRQGPQA